MYPKDKIVSMKDLSRYCYRQRKIGDSLVLTSGCFDLLHGGHLEYLLNAAKFGFLVVGVNDDSSVKRLKGDSRPIRGQDDRVFLVAGFECVELAVLFGDDVELIQAVRPTTYIASSTSHVKIYDDPVRLQALRKIGCTIIELESMKSDSTTDMIRRTQAAPTDRNNQKHE